ncbi:MAG TPA: FAD-dependent oxidoreductase [Rhodocyclaceae bacterium]|nr:FAD-dependent oxidoreductase [Rhodocyclaceae bacterium]
MSDHHPVLPGRPVSLWLDTTSETGFPALAERMDVDVAVVGGGIAGLTAATLLKAAGKTVAVVEAGRIAAGVTGHTTAKITALHTLIYDHLVRHFGEDKARAYGEAQQAAIELIAALVAERDIDCDFARTEAYTYTDSDEEVPAVEAEARVALALGLPAAYVPDPPLPFPVKGAVRFDHQARFHPRKYLLALASDLPGKGCHIFEQTRVTEVAPGEPCTVVTDRGHLRARDVIVASHFPFADKALFASRLQPQRSYVLAVRLDGPAPPGMFIDTAEAFSLRSQPLPGGRELALITGAGHPAGEGGDTTARYQRLEMLARSRLPVRSVEYRWSTQDNFTLDRVPYIGRTTHHSRHLYVATGFNGWGMTGGTVAAMVLRDLILGEDNPWAEVFDPSRLDLGSVPELVRHNVKVAAHFVADRVAGTDSDSIAPGEGKIVHGLHGNVALYRDDEGQVHRHSPVCTHMGCILRWNPAERSWDCPCHGSRFGYDGEVLHGPAVRPLDKR